MKRPARDGDGEKYRAERHREAVTQRQGKSGHERTMVRVPPVVCKGRAHGAGETPQSGTSYDRHDGPMHLMLGAVGDLGRHLSRNIGDVTSIDVITDGGGRDLGLRIAHGQRETVITLTK
jgi:hypothetical protein